MEEGDTKIEDLKLKCQEPGCNALSKTFPTLNSLRGHYITKHKTRDVPITVTQEIRTMAKNTKETPKDVKASVTIPDSSKELQALMQKVDTIFNALPPNFCEEFPNLCKLDGKVEGLAETINDLKKVIPAKINIKIPKPEIPELKVPEVDLSTITDSIDKGIEKLSKQSAQGLTEKLTSSNMDLTSKLEALITTLATTKVSKPETPTKTEKSEPVKTESKEVIPTEEPKEQEHTHIKTNQPVHTKAEEYFACPECNTALLTALKAKLAKSEDLDKSTEDFLNSIKIMLAKKGEGKIEQSNTEGDDAKEVRVQTNTKQDRSSDPVRKGAGTVTRETDSPNDGTRIEQDKSTDPVTAKSSSSSHREECKSGFCLLRNHRKPSTDTKTIDAGANT